MREPWGIINPSTKKLVCPLQNVEVRATLDSNIAKVKVIQNYHYTGPNNIEAIYTFPIVHNAQVVGFIVRNGDKEIIGEFKEKEEAFKEYDEAIRKGDSAYLLESHRPDIFQVSLGNIISGESISIEITYIEDLDRVDNEIRWNFPTVLAPRYKSDPSIIVGEITDTNYTLDMDIRLIHKEEIKKISSSSHPIEILNEKSTIIKLANKNQALDSDFILNISLNNEVTNSLVVGENSYGEVFAALSFTPEIPYIDNKDVVNEYIFLIDISGSMDGEKLKQAKRALNLSLRNISEGSSFNIIAFESDYYPFSQEMVVYNQANLNKAEKWIRELKSLGGTEIYEPLEFALEKISGKENTQRIVFLFTDGQVGNEDEIIHLVSKHKKDTIMYPFGIDTAVNKYFIDGLAKAGNGMAEYVYPGESIEDKVIRQFARTYQPYINKPRIVDNHGKEIEVYPVLPIRMYDGENYKIYFKADDSKDINSVTLIGEIDGEEKSYKIEKNSLLDGELLSLKWAKEYIRFLEEQLGGNPRRAKLMKDDIINLSLKYKLMSTLTSLVAIYKREVKERGELETVVVPVNPPRLWSDNNFSSSISYQLKPVESLVYESSLSFEAPIFFRKKTKMKSSKPVTRNLEIDQTDIQIDRNMITSKFDTVKETIMNTATKQNADGSFGRGFDVGAKTLNFLLGMTLYPKEASLYRMQILKALKILLRLKDEYAPIKAYVFKKIMEEKFHLGFEIKERLDEILANLSQEDLEVFLSLDSDNIDEISKIITGKKMEKPQFLEYLFNQI